MTEIETRLTEIFHVVFDDPSLVLRRDLVAAEVVGWDSLNHVRLMISVQDAFGIEFDIDEIVSLRNVGDLLDTVQRKTSPRQG